MPRGDRRAPPALESWLPYLFCIAPIVAGLKHASLPFNQVRPEALPIQLAGRPGKALILGRHCPKTDDRVT